MHQSDLWKISENLFNSALHIMYKKVTHINVNYLQGKINRKIRHEKIHVIVKKL